jgi:hypothetical protein
MTMAQWLQLGEKVDGIEAAFPKWRENVTFVWDEQRGDTEALQDAADNIRSALADLNEKEKPGEAGTLVAAAASAASVAATGQAGSRGGSSGGRGDGGSGCDGGGGGGTGNHDGGDDSSNGEGLSRSSAVVRQQQRQALQYFLDMLNYYLQEDQEQEQEQEREQEEQEEAVPAAAAPTAEDDDDGHRGDDCADDNDGVEVVSSANSPVRSGPVDLTGGNPHNTAMDNSTGGAGPGRGVNRTTKAAIAAKAAKANQRKKQRVAPTDAELDDTGGGGTCVCV